MSARHLVAVALASSLVACGGKPPTDGSGNPGDGSGTPELGNRRTDWTNGAVVYEVFVRSFQDSNGDGIGDLKGLLSRLDYLSDLGVDALWLMPVFASPSYHGYDISDYERINPDYGTNDDFQQLATEAHKRGIKLILDFVMNHTSSQHPWFVDSASSATAAHRDWYVWSSSDPGWTQPWGGTSRTWNFKNGAYYYSVFWSGMPDLNYRSNAVRTEMKRLAGLWLDRGADGFRLDAARYLVENGPANQAQDTSETHAFWRDFSATVRAARPEAMIVGEVWADTTTISSYYGSTQTVPGGNELPLQFDFPLASQLIKGVNDGEATGIAGQLLVTQRVYGPGITDAPFLSNHDQVRVATQLGANLGKAKNAGALLLTLPGTAFVYYGEELGMQNGGGGADEAKRAPMPWDGTDNGGFSTSLPWYPFTAGQETRNVAAETSDPASVLSRYRKLIHTRKASAALTRGGLLLLTPTSGTSSTLAFVRVEGDERVLVVHNLTDSFANGGPFLVPQGEAEALFQDDGASISGGPNAWTVSLPPRGTGIWRMR